MNLSDQLELINNWFRITARPTKSDNENSERLYEETFPADENANTTQRIEDYHSIEFVPMCSGDVGFYLYDSDYKNFYAYIYDSEDLNTPIATLYMERNSDVNAYDTVSVKAFHKYIIKFDRYPSKDGSEVQFDMLYNVRAKSKRFIKYN